MAKRKPRNFTPAFKTEVVLEACRGETSRAELCRRRNLSDDQLSQWKQQFFENGVSVFASKDQRDSETGGDRFAHLGQLVGRLTVALDIEKRALTGLNSPRLRNENALKRCGGIIPGEHFAKRWVLTGTFSIITR